MEEQSQNTEALILEAARKVFIEKGLEGARMQEIADEAGINKSLLHYYFRSKDKLFHAVFIEAFQKFLPQIDSLILTQAPVAVKLEAFITNYINTIIQNPFIPGFVLHELSRDPQSLAELLKSRASMVPQFLQQIQDEIDAGRIKPFDPRQIIINTLGLCIFPFVARPIAQTIFFENNTEAYNQFLEDRKTEVFKFIKSAIFTEQQ